MSCRALSANAAAMVIIAAMCIANLFIAIRMYWYDSIQLLFMAVNIVYLFRCIHCRHMPSAYFRWVVARYACSCVSTLALMRCGNNCMLSPTSGENMYSAAKLRASSQADICSINLPQTLECLSYHREIVMSVNNGQY